MIVNMFTLSHRAKWSLALASGVSTSIGLAFVCRRFGPKLFDKVCRSYGAERVVGNMVISIASNETQCVELVGALKSNMKAQPILGFDCEWVQITDRRPVALLQLATKEGLCALFQLCLYTRVPSALKDLLEDRSILKVGLDPLNDAKYLICDYGINVTGTVDLRHLSPNFSRMGLASIVERELGIVLPKSRGIRTSDWENPDLSYEQQQYAAKDALCSVLAFFKLINTKVDIPFFASKDHECSLILEYCHQIVDVRFRNKMSPAFNAKVEARPHPLQRTNTSSQGPSQDSYHKKSFRAYSLRKKPLYHNCVLLAPDGEVLCTCDVRKADWYVSKGLASIEDIEPYKVRLLFEPSGRAQGLSGQYYTIEKINQCVVCGRKDSYLRKKIVPHEYRRYFPESMKKHQSHDVLLLCAPCHLKSNSSDLALRVKLAKACGAPMDAEENSKVREDHRRKRLRSAARALVGSSVNMPDERQKELRNVILESYPEVTTKLLMELKDAEIHIINENYAPHGLLVVEHFGKKGIEGIKKLEKIWREHFLNSMMPNFLPPLWSVDHYHHNEKQYSWDDSFLNRVKHASQNV